MTRLECIASFIEDNEKVIDVGCDQAPLSIILAKRGIYSIASDLRSNIIESAIKSTSNNLKKFIDFRVGDGITLKEEENDFTLVLAGMGTYTVLNILKNTDKTFNKIIISSNNNLEMLRKEMSILGYIILKEQVIKEKNKYYDIIVFIKGNKTYTKEELLLGVNHIDQDLFKERNKELYNKYLLINKQTGKLTEEVEILKKNI